MNRLRIRNLVRKGLGETTSAFWTDVELNDLINDAGRDIAERTKSLKTDTTITTIQDQSDYSITSYFTNLISITEVYYKQDGQSWQKLIPIIRTEQDILFPGWLSTDAGTPTHYTYDLEENIFRLYPKPDSDNAGSYCRVFYSRDFTDLNSDADSPSFTFDLQEAMVEYCIAQGYRQRGWNEKYDQAWRYYISKLSDYIIERHREKEDDVIIMKNYRNI